MTNDLDLDQRLRRLERRVPVDEMPIRDPVITPGHPSYAWMIKNEARIAEARRRQAAADEQARLEREEARLEREEAEAAAAERRRVNAPKIDKLKREIAELEAKHEPLTEAIRAKWRELGDLL